MHTQCAEKAHILHAEVLTAGGLGCQNRASVLGYVAQLVRAQHS